MKKKSLRIGESGWLKRLHDLSRSEHTALWAGFSSCSDNQLSKLQATVGRTLDPEFTEFYRTIGFGQFPTGGGFDSPEEIAAEFDAALYFVTGSMTPGEEWATAAEHRRLWVTRGEENPNRRLFTDEAITVHGVKLYDLMQFGSDGSCGYWSYQTEAWGHVCFSALMTISSAYVCYLSVQRFRQEVRR